ncbi:MAG: efflux RND transporter periplasmic adaptor subunit [Candidatus Paceibacterota bacterium]
MRWNRNKIIVTAITGIIIVSVGFILNRQRTAQQEVESTVVKRGVLKEELALAGEIDADEKVTLAFQTSGRLGFVGVKEGDTVRRGQLVASLDQRSVKKNIEKELNDFLTARWDLDQERDDAEGKALTDAIKRAIDKAQFSVNNTILDVELQEIAIEFSKLFSPISGVVTRIDTPLAGVNVKANTDKIEIINPDTIFFVATADQTEVTELSEGMPAEIVLDAFPDQTLSGTISTIAFTPEASETGTVYEIKIKFSDVNLIDKIRVGMTGDTTFITQEKTGALYLPFKYVQTEEDRSFVYIMKNGKRVKKTVKTGIETEEFVEVKGLEKGEVVYD